MHVNGTWFVMKNHKLSHSNIVFQLTLLNRHLSLGGHVEFQENEKLCFRTASLGEVQVQCEAYRAKRKLFILLRLNMAAV